MVAHSKGLGEGEGCRWIPHSWGGTLMVPVHEGGGLHRKLDEVERDEPNDVL